MKKELIIRELTAMKEKFARSAWDKGVYDYAFDILEPLDNELEDVSAERLMNGSTSWLQYSRGGCALIYSYDIARRMCTSSEYKRYLRAGERSKYSDSSYWLDDVQCRALFQAMAKIRRAYSHINYGNTTI